MGRSGRPLWYRLPVCFELIRYLMRNGEILRRLKRNLQSGDILEELDQIIR